MKLKLIPQAVALTLCGSLALGCANQDNVDAKKPSGVSLTVTDTTIPSTFMSVATEPPPATVIAAVAPAPPAPVDKKSSASNEPDLPKQTTFYFKFDKADISPQDIAHVQAHANYLLTHADLKIAINGHTDFYGPETYNEQLSKKRAESVAKIFIAAGVPQSRLTLHALADHQPQECKNDTRHNRRVELHYQESTLASKD
ncbi:MAG: OmpA family protein [Gammaproteobacteria bacterium]|nr:OmpA family protein [Gammaproteobacteria bacterium]